MDVPTWTCQTSSGESHGTETEKEREHLLTGASSRQLGSAVPGTVVPGAAGWGHQSDSAVEELTKELTQQKDVRYPG